MQPKYAVALLVIGAVVFVKACGPEETKPQAANPVAPVAPIAPIAPGATTTPTTSPLAEQFKAERPAMMAAMEKALQTKNYASSMSYGEDFKSVSDPEFDSLWGRVVLAEAKAPGRRSDGSPWSYESATDTMTGKPSKTATVKSKNSLNFGFPYSGSNYGTLQIRQHPKYGQDVIFAIEKGQISCSPHSCQIGIKFDDEKPVAYSGSPPADHSSKHIFLSNSARFIAKAKKANRIYVEFTAYQEGTNVMQFITDQPVVWPPK